jgi:hypothetical protein
MHQVGRNKKHVQDFSVGIMDERDIFADADISECNMKKQIKKDVRVWSRKILFILDFSSILLSTGK